MVFLYGHPYTIRRFISKQVKNLLNAKISPTNSQLTWFRHLKNIV